MNTSAIIVEDEIPAAMRLRRLLEARGFTIICTLASASKLREYLLCNPHPDWLFLDIELRDGTVFGALENKLIGSKIVFITAYQDRALEAFGHAAVGYLLKPVDEKKLDDALLKVAHLGQVLAPNHDLSTPDAVLVSAGRSIRKIPMNAIAYFSSEENTTFLHTENREFPLGKSLDKLEAELQRSQFFRISRKYIVGRGFIKLVSDDDVTLTYRNLKLRISRSRKKQFLTWFENNDKKPA